MAITKNPAQATLDKSTTTPSSSKGFTSKEKTELDRSSQTGDLEAIVASKGLKNIADAVEKVVLLYSYARQADVFEFIKEYTKRPIANFVEILGSADLRIEKVEEFKTRSVKQRYTIKSTKPATYASTQDLSAEDIAVAEKLIEGPSSAYKWVQKKYTEESYKVVQGVEGFHSRAFSDKDDLFGLADTNTKKILGLKRKDQKLLAKMDTRKEKRQAIRTYLSDLLGSQGAAG